MTESKPVFLTARWQNLLMLNYEVDPALLHPYVPVGTELDEWQGKTFVSLVGFRFLDTRVLGVPILFHRNFDEVNLRFYVRCKAGDAVRRGVVFIKEVVPRRVVSWVARTVYNEPYVTMPMRHEVVLPGGVESGEGLVRYGWRTGGRWHEMSARMDGNAMLPGDESLEAFIAEHYWGYTRQRDGSTTCYEVRHPPWQVWRGSGAGFDGDVRSVYGQEWVDTLCRQPSSAFVARGSEVSVHRGSRLVA